MWTSCLARIPSRPCCFSRSSSIDQIDRVIEPDSLPLVDGGNPQRRGQVSFPGPGSTDQNHVVSLGHEASRSQLFDAMLGQRRLPCQSKPTSPDGWGIGPL